MEYLLILLFANFSNYILGKYLCVFILWYLVWKANQKFQRIILYYIYLNWFSNFDVQNLQTDTNAGVTPSIRSVY